MKKLLSVVAVAALFVACGTEPGDELPSDEELSADVWDEIQGYDSWGQVDPWTGVQPHGGTHGGAPFVQIWFNDLAESNHGSTIPDGGISVKETYDAEDGEALKIFVMKKIAGYDEANGDWFYARYSTDGSVDTSGQAAIGGCAGCHNDGEDVDRLLTARDDPPESEE